MSILDANGSVACAECGRKARDERDQLKAENAKLREELELWHRLTVGIKFSEYRTAQFQPCEHFEPKVVDE